ncbi:MAG TPA: helix-turn-helix transcriptional regulator [Anaerolineales bacterium]|nr:helix-turn-helix transcriptional regulator [Anaerolineales bacterium]HND90580.1 helix-turn-helix transcriptional regulator [Anaerolineales bacterium]
MKTNQMMADNLPEHLNKLSPREIEVVDHVLQGKSNKQIAFQLGITERTVEFHLKNVYTKLGIGSRMELAVKLWKSADDEVKASLRESTVAESVEIAENGNQPMWAASVKRMLSVLKKEFAMTMKTILNDLGNAVQKHLLAFSLFYFIAAGLMTHYLVVGFGLYFIPSYLLLGLVLGMSSLYLGLRWHGIKSGEVHVRPIWAVGFLALPFLAGLLDLTLLATLAKAMGEVTVNLIGLSSRAVWMVADNGSPFLSLSRSITLDDIWLYGPVLYMSLLALAGRFYTIRILKRTDAV